MRYEQFQPANTTDNLAETPIAIASTAVALSPAFDLLQGWQRSLFFKLDSSGTPDVKVEVVVAYWDEKTNTYSDYVLPSGASALIANAVTKNLYCVGFSVPAAVRAKVRFTGQGTNPADVTVSDLRIVYGKAE